MLTIVAFSGIRRFGYSFWTILLQIGFTAVKLGISSQDQHNIPKARAKIGSPQGSAREPSSNKAHSSCDEATPSVADDFRAIDFLRTDVFE